MLYLLTLSILLSLTRAPEQPVVPAATVCLSPEEQKLYDLIMAYRRSKKLPVIPLSAKLTMVAQAHTRDLTSNFVDDTPEGCNTHSWSDKGSWTPCCYTPDHKQAACMWNKPREIAGYQSNGFEIAYWSSAGANAVEALDGWKSSPGHHAVIINDDIWKSVQWKAEGISVYAINCMVLCGKLADDERPGRCNN